jgi:ABC-type arginine transport system permease subunit
VAICRHSRSLSLTLRVSAVSLAVPACSASSNGQYRVRARRASRDVCTLIRGMPGRVGAADFFYGGQIGVNKLAESQDWDYRHSPSPPAC